MANRNRVAREAIGGTGRDAGFTVIEISVAVVVFTIVMGAIYGLLMVARGGRLNTNQRSEILQNARIAINTMSRDAINAGVGYPNLGATLPDDRLATIMGGTADADTDPDVLTPVFARNDSQTINGVATDQITFLFIDDTFNGGVSLPITEIRNQGAELGIQPGFNNAPCAQGDIYIVTGQNGSALGMMHDGGTEVAGTNTDRVTFATADPLQIDNPGATSPIGNIQAPASLQRVSWVSYFLVPDVGTDAGTGVLIRRVHGGATGWVDQPLAFGIENLQIQYVLIDGSVVDVPAAGQMDDIRQVRLSVAVRSPDPDPNAPRDPVTGQHLPFRTTLTSTFSTRNLVYEKI
jgi:prepilin-type N-terminal cleavage/methylation domain-containing protein